MRYQFLFKFELEVILSSREWKEGGVYVLVELEVQYLLSEQLA
jgi:hypothetical protein